MRAAAAGAVVAKQLPHAALRASSRRELLLWQPTMTSLFLVGVAAGLASATPPARVAIVGGGIAGGATSYYLQKFLAGRGLPNASLVVFERNHYVGGRLHEVTFGSQQLLIEVGGAAWTNNNHYMIELAAAMHMNTSLTTPNADAANLVVWNGSALTGGIPLVLRNLRGIVKTLGIEAEFLHTLEANYAQQATTTFRNLSTTVSYTHLTLPTILLV